jgi:hypothetical protein
MEHQRNPPTHRHSTRERHQRTPHGVGARLGDQTIPGPQTTDRRPHKGKISPMCKSTAYRGSLSTHAAVQPTHTRTEDLTIHTSLNTLHGTPRNRKHTPSQCRHLVVPRRTRRSHDPPTPVCRCRWPRPTHVQCRPMTRTAAARRLRKGANNHKNKRMLQGPKHHPRNTMYE